MCRRDKRHLYRLGESAVGALTDNLDISLTQTWHVTYKDLLSTWTTYMAGTQYMPFVIVIFPARALITVGDHYNLSIRRRMAEELIQIKNGK